MKLRTLAVVGGLAVSILTAGCVASVAGQAEVDPGAIAARSAGSAHSVDPGTGGSGDIGSGSESPSSGTTGTTQPGTPLPGTTLTIGSATTLVFSTSLTVTGRTTLSDDKSVPFGTTGAAGAALCNKVIGGLTAFSALLSKAGDTISQTTVETTLAAMPASGLPAAIQPDMTVLRSLVSSVAGKSGNDLAVGLTDATAIAAVEDLTNWAAQNCS